MKPFKIGDRVSVLYLSRTRGTCLAMSACFRSPVLSSFGP